MTNFLSKFVNLFKAYVPYLIYLLIAILALRAVLLANGSFGLAFDWSFNDSPTILSQYSREVLNAYSDRYLGNSPTYDSAYFYSLLIAFLAQTGITGGMISKGILLIGTASSGALIYILLNRKFSISKFSAFLAGIIYMLSPFMFYKAVAGHAFEIISYALIPLFTLSIINAFSSKRPMHLILWSIFSSILLIIIGAQIQYLLFGFVVMIIMFLVSNGRKNYKFISSTIVIFSTAIYSLPWLLPIILGKNFSGSYEGKFTVLKIIRESPFLGFSNSLQGREGYGMFFQQTLNQLPMILQIWYAVSSMIFIGLTIYGISVLLNKRSSIKLQDINTPYFGFVFVGFFLALLFFIKGVNEPFGFINQALFENISSLGIFRNLYHIVGLTLFLSVIYFAFGLDRIQQKFRVSKKYLMMITVIGIGGFGGVYVTGDYGGYIYPYKSNSNLESLASQIKGSRALFFPNLQPFVEVGSNRTLGGWDSFQSYVDASTVHQSEGQTTAQKYDILKMNRCMIFEDNCSEDVVNFIKAKNIRYVVFRKDIKSIYNKVSGIGGDRLNNKFNKTDYIQKINNLGFMKIQENDTYVLYDTKVHDSPVKLTSKMFNAYGGNSESSLSPYIKFDERTFRGKSSAYSGNISENNNNRMASFERNKNATIIEPGFSVNIDSWKSYLTYWWRDGYLNSGYNGVHADINNVPLKIPAKLNSTGNQNLWITSSDLSNYADTKLKIEIPSIGFSKIIEVNDSNRLNGEILVGKNLNLGEKKIDVILTSLTGNSSVDTLIFSPEIQNMEKSIAYVNSKPSKTESTARVFNTNVQELTTSLTSNMQPNSKVNFEQTGNDNAVQISLNNTDISKGNAYVKLNLQLDNMSSRDLLKLSEFSYTYKSNIKSNSKVKVDTTIGIKDPTGRINPVSIDSNYINNSINTHTIKMSSLKEQIAIHPQLSRYDLDKLQIESLALYVNLEPVKLGPVNISFSNLYFTGNVDQFYSESSYISLLKTFSKSEYYKNLSNQSAIASYKRNNSIDLYSLTANKDDGKKTTVSALDNNITLKATEANTVSEYALMTTNISSYKDGYIVLPFTTDDSKTFIDYEIALKNPLTNSYMKTLPYRAVSLDHKSYVIVDVGDLKSKYPGFEPYELRTILNKRILSNGQDFTFFLNGLYNIPENFEFRNYSETLSSIHTTYRPVVSDAGTYKLITNMDDGTYLEDDIELNKGTNIVNISSPGKNVRIKNIGLINMKKYLSKSNETTAEIIKVEKNESTKYKVIIKSDIKQQSYITINNNYDANWKILRDGKLIGYSISGGSAFNSFRVHLKPGINEFDTVYSLQKDRIFGLYAAGAWMIIQLGIIVIIFVLYRKDFHAKV